MAIARCMDCGFVLAGLPPGKCPACGRSFDLSDPFTYSDVPIFKARRFWLPGVCLALVSGAILYPLLIFDIGFGWTVTLVLPFCIGTLVGFGTRVSKFLTVLLALAVLCSLVLGLFSLSIVGVYCGLVLAGIAVGPLILGTMVGAGLRILLKGSRWEQRWHLPLISILFTPLVVGAIEGRFTKPFVDETASTTIVLPVSVDRAWDAVMFYEEVHLPLPFLMKIALPHPLYTVGSIEHVGDVKICVYSKGRLVKRIDDRVPNQRLAFYVIQQTHIENRSVRLERGSFEFKPLGENQTQITLTTQYEPLLGPRWVWRWSELIGFHTLHSYVLEGMRQKAIDDSIHPKHKPPPPIPPPVDVTSIGPPS